MSKQKLELTWIGKDKHPKLEPRILLEDLEKSYRASAGVRAINELKPLFGLELTATPFVESSCGPVPFKNVVMDYPLARAMEDGFVKEPAVVTQRDFDARRYKPEEIEKIKLEDGIRLHEATEAERQTARARIAVVPTGEVTVGFNPFTLDVNGLYGFGSASCKKHPRDGDGQKPYQADAVWRLSKMPLSLTEVSFRYRAPLSDLADAEVQAKADAAAKWCQHASEYAANNGGKPWVYLVIPHDEINESRRLGDFERFSRRAG
jgi:hypothetical protein